MTRVIYKLNGKLVTRAKLNELVPPKEGWLNSPPMASNTYTEHSPLISEGCGVMPAQVKEARDAIKKHNIAGAAVHDNGQIRFTSRRARKEFLSMRGLKDLDGGFSD